MPDPKAAAEEAALEKTYRQMITGEKYTPMQKRILEVMEQYKKKPEKEDDDGVVLSRK